MLWYARNTRTPHAPLPTGWVRRERECVCACAFARARRAGALHALHCTALHAHADCVRIRKCGRARASAFAQLALIASLRAPSGPASRPASLSVRTGRGVSVSSCGVGNVANITSVCLVGNDAHAAGRTRRGVRGVRGYEGPYGPAPVRRITRRGYWSTHSGRAGGSTRASTAHPPEHCLPGRTCGYRRVARKARPWPMHCSALGPVPLGRGPT
jgi:hypothetical protein